MRILLIRHGPSAHSSSLWRPATRADLEQWRADYDLAGIAADSTAPASLRAHVLHADVVVASNLPRAVASASHLWPRRPIVISPLFREMPLRIPSLGRVRAPLPLWELLIHLQWGIDTLRGRDIPAEARARSAAAADWCVQACRDHGPTSIVAVVTHGVFRRALAHALVARGWRIGGRRRSYAPWSVWELASMDVSFGPLANER
jgi:broad specificity phosphatase PhoE